MGKDNDSETQGLGVECLKWEQQESLAERHRSLNASAGGDSETEPEVTSLHPVNNSASQLS